MLQIGAWLLLRPSAWCHFVEQIGEGQLRANFCWAELGSQQRQKPIFQRLLFLEYGVLPLVVGVCVGLGLGLFRQAWSDIAFGVCVGWAASVATAIAGSWIISVGASWIASAIGGLFGGLLFGLMGADSLVVFRSGFGVDNPDLSVLVEALLPPLFMASFPNGVGAGVVLAIDNASPFTRRANQQSGQRSGQHSGQGSGQQLGGIAGGIMLGVIASGLVLVVGGSIISTLASSEWSNTLGFVAKGGEQIAFGGVLGAVLGLMVARHTRRWRSALIWGGAVGLGLACAVGLALSAQQAMVRGWAIGGGNALLLTALFALAYTLAAEIAGVSAGAIAGVLGSSTLHTLFVSLTIQAPLLPTLLLSLLFTTLGLTFPRWLSIFLYPFELVWQLLLSRSQKSETFSWHPACWDEQQRLPLWGLDQYLVNTMNRSPSVGQAAFDYLSQGPQRWAVQRAQIELDAQQLERCESVSAIASLHLHLTQGDLRGPTTQLMLSFRQLSADSQAALNQSSPYSQRLMLNTLERQIIQLIQDLSRSHSLHANRFRPIFQRWQHIIRHHQQHLAHQSELSQTIESPYIVGIPLTQQQDIFVGRQDISAKIERLLRERRYSSLLLYGQRRMGKTSLLNNLGKLLPTHIVPIFIDLQGPITKSPDHIGFLYNLARGIAHSAKQNRQLSLPRLSRETLSVDPFTAFDEWLDQIETYFEGKTALLALDEFEALDQALRKDRFDQDAVLSLLRNIIQHRPKFKVLLSGSHTLAGLHHWASYLINLQVLHISYLQPSEALRLIEQPVKDFSLRYEPGATQRLLELTHGHPFLVQLLCAEIIALKNEQPCANRRRVTVTDVEAAISPALLSGSFFFADIEHTQPQAIPLLRRLARSGGCAQSATFSDRDFSVSPQDLLPQDLPLVQLLIQQGILEDCSGRYQFQVELIRYWFCQQHKSTTNQR